MVLRRLFFFLAFLFPTALGLRAQTDSLLVEGDSLHRGYRFAEALERYARASAQTADADTIRLLRSRMDQSQNALNMTDFCADPVVVARERFSRKDFFLFYPLKKGFCLKLFYADRLASRVCMWLGLLADILLLSFCLSSYWHG